MNAKEMFLDFLNLIFFITVVGLSILYFIAGDHFTAFKELMQSLAPFGLFGILFLAVIRVNRETNKKRVSEGNDEIEITLSLFDKFKIELFVFLLPMIISAISWLSNGKVLMNDFIIASVVFIFAWLFRSWLFSKERA